jgi:hypothetical protein
MAHFTTKKFIMTLGLKSFLETTTVNWIRSLNEELGEWFLDKLSEKSMITSHNSGLAGSRAKIIIT